jgi:threonine aldolase
MKRLRNLADAYGLKIHLDGARLWNTSIATNIPIAGYTALADTVSLCFSKGLGAPIGSILAGTEECIERAHYYRKAYGGGMRQAGLLAAGAIYALNHNLPKLKRDHQRAKTLAQVLSSLETFDVDPAVVETNIIIIKVMDPGKTAAEISAELREHGILISAISKDKLRAVLHIGLTDSDIDTVHDRLTRLYH